MPQISQLSPIISGLLRSAQETPGAPQRHILTGGLNIAIKITPDGYTHLQLSRQNSAPSALEWTVVLKSFPYSINIAPTPKDYKNTVYFVAKWPTPPKQPDLLGQEAQP